jgi:hypothetical protein
LESISTQGVVDRHREVSLAALQLLGKKELAVDLLLSDASSLVEQTLPELSKTRRSSIMSFLC